MNILLTLLKILKFPLKLLTKLRRKRPQKTELEQKQLKHVRNFAPTHYSWQKRTGKKLTEKQKEYYRKKRKNRKLSKKTNNFSKNGKLLVKGSF